MVVGLIALSSTSVIQAKRDAGEPAQSIAWQPWQPIGSCKQVTFGVTVGEDEEHRHRVVKLKIENKNTYAIQTRFNAVIESAKRKTKTRRTVQSGPLNAGAASTDCGVAKEFCFEMAPGVNVSKLFLTNIDVTHIDAPSTQASLATYLDQFRDSTKSCRDLAFTFEHVSSPEFIKLTDRCVKGLPHWTRPDCDNAVDEVIKASEQANSLTEKNCISEWRAYQKCYDIYAFDSNPIPRPTCQRPECSVKR